MAKNGAASAASAASPATGGRGKPHSKADGKGRGGKKSDVATEGLWVSVLIVLVWYTASFFTDAFNKQVQQQERLPITVTFVQFLSGALWSTLLLRGTSARPFIPLRKDQLQHLLPISACWTIGFLTTNLSLGRTAVSFTHAIKATEPVFLVVLATYVFHQSFPTKVWLSLIPICLGIVLVAMTELEFSVLGLVSAVTANCCFVLRSIFAKRIFQSKLVDNFNLFYYMSWIAAAATAPLALYWEGPLLLHGARTGALLPLTALILANGTLHYIYNQASMLLLDRVPALTHSIVNAARRFVIIMAAVLYFGKPLSAANMAGIGILMVGVFYYARVKAEQAKPEK